MDDFFANDGAPQQPAPPGGGDFGGGDFGDFGGASPFPLSTRQTIRQRGGKKRKRIK